MSVLVVDASVLAKVFFVEADSALAERTLSNRTHTLIAPELLWLELGNIAWKKVRRGEVTAELANDVLAVALSMSIEITAITEHIDKALQLALQTNRTVYDSLYLALAITEDAVLLTADERFANSIRALPVPALKDRVRLLAEFA